MRPDISTPSDSARWTLGAGERWLVSVVVTAYNQAWVLAETLGSVVAQTYRPLECVIVDDGSSDNTTEVVASFVENMKRT